MVDAADRIGTGVSAPTRDAADRCCRHWRLCCSARVRPIGGALDPAASAGHFVARRPGRRSCGRSLPSCRRLPRNHGRRRRGTVPNCSRKRAPSAKLAVARPRSRPRSRWDPGAEPESRTPRNRIRHRGHIRGCGLSLDLLLRSSARHQLDSTWHGSGTRLAANSWTVRGGSTRADPRHERLAGGVQRMSFLDRLAAAPID